MASEYESSTNPAGRLLQILKKANSSNTIARQQKLTSWSQILGTPEAELETLLRRIAIVAKLPDEIERLIREQHGDSASKYLTWLPQVKTGLACLNLNSPFNEVTNPIDGNTLALLEICDDQLSAFKPDIRIDAPSLHTLMKDAKSLRDSLSKIEMSEHLRDYLRKHLELVERAIGDYWLQGTEVLTVALEQSIGLMLTRSELAQESASTSIGQKVFGILGRYVQIATAVYVTLQLPGEIAKLLPDGSENTASEVKPESVDSGALAAEIEQGC